MHELESHICLAVDIGGSKLDIGLFNARGELLGKAEKHRVPFDDGGIADPEGLIELIAPFIERVKDLSRRFHGIGLSVCGNIDRETGEAILVPNLHWRNIHFGRMVEERFGCRIFPATDVRMAALAEVVWGAAQNSRSFAWATIGTGYGGYLFLNRKLYGGSHGFAGNFGHNTLDEVKGYPCGCGRRGCVETFVAGPAIARAGQTAVDAGHSPALVELSGGGPVTPQMVFQAEARGDSAAQEIIKQEIRLVSISLAGLVNILDLDMIVLGGGVTHATPDFIQRVSNRIRDFLMTAEAARDLRVVPESFFNSALYGAAADVFISTKVLPLGPFD